MASEINTLTDFFVSIGFAVDKPSAKRAAQDHGRVQQQLTATEKRELDRREKGGKAQRERDEKAEVAAERKRRERIRKSLDASAVSVAKFSLGATAAIAGVELTALGVAAAVEKAAQSFSRLYYASQRAGSSAASMTAFGYAAGQLGSDAGTADSSLQTFGMKLKMYPGYRQSLARLLGHKVDGVDSGVLATQLGEKLRQIRDTQGLAQAMAQGRVYGFEDPQLVSSMMDPRYGAKEAERRAQQARIGADPDAAARTGTAFEQAATRFTSILEDVGTRIQANVEQHLLPQVNALSDWMEKNGKVLADFVAAVADGIVKLAAAIANSDVVKAAVDGLIGGLQWLTEHVTSDVFKKDVDTFITNVGDLARAIAQAVAWIMGKLRYLGLAGEVQPAQGEVYGEHDGSHPIVTSHGGRTGLGRRLGMEPAVPFEADEFKKATGADDKQYDSMRMGIADIEGARYGQMGGSSGRFAGRYQMGSAEIAETARSLGEATPSREQFLGDPQLQERFFQRYTLNHYKQLSSDPAFRKLSLAEKLGVLGYAHNQGVGGALSYLHSGVEGHDAFGTGGGAYIKAIRKRLSLASLPPAASIMKGRPELPKGAMYWAKDSQGNDVAVDAQGRAVDSHGKPTTVSQPLGVSTTDNSRSLSLTHNPVFHIKGSDLAVSLATARLSAGRGWKDMLRDGQGAEQ